LCGFLGPKDIEIRDDVVWHNAYSFEEGATAVAGFGHEIRGFAYAGDNSFIETANIDLFQ